MAGRAASAFDLRAKYAVPRDARAPAERGRRLLAVELPGYPAEHRRRAAQVDARDRPRHLRQAEGQFPRPLADDIVPGARLDAAALAEVEEKLDVVRPRHVEPVLDDHAPRLLVERNAAAVRHPIRQPRLAVVPGPEQGALVARPTAAHAGVRLLPPHENAPGAGMIAPAQPDAVVAARAA